MLKVQNYLFQLRKLGAIFCGCCQNGRLNKPDFERKATIYSLFSERLSGLVYVILYCIIGCGRGGGAAFVCFYFAVVAFWGRGVFSLSLFN